MNTQLKAEIRIHYDNNTVTVNRGKCVRKYHYTVSSFMRLVRLSDNATLLVATSTMGVYWWTKLHSAIYS